MEVAHYIKNNGIERSRNGNHITCAKKTLTQANQNVQKV